MDKVYAYFQNWSNYLIVDIFACVVVILLAFLFFYHKRSLRVLITVMSVVAIKTVVDVLGIYLGKDGNSVFVLCSLILKYFLMFLIITIVVVYQSDFRSIFQRIATPHGIDLFAEGFGSDDELHAATDELLSALQTMAKQNTGAIIILTPTSIDSNILETGTELNAKISAALLVSIFNTKTPLHDGAVIVKGNKILSAGCFLPLTQEEGVAKELGTRHRAALGITEESNVMAIVVSEETGIISVASGGQLQRYMTIDKLKERIESVYGISPITSEAKNEVTTGKKKRRFFR